MMRTGKTDHVGVNEFAEWLLTADLGDQFIYAVGELAADCCNHVSHELRLVRDAVQAAARNGKIVLTQKPGALLHGNTTARAFNYIATRAEVKPPKPAKLLSAGGRELVA